MKYHKILIFLLVILLHPKAMAQCDADAGRDTSICAGGTIRIGGVVSGSGTGPLTYSWSPSTGLSCTTCPNPNATVGIDRTYTLTVTDNTGCTATSDISISVFTPDPASFTYTGGNACGNLPVNFTSTTAGDALRYSWNFGHTASGAANFSSLPNPSHEFYWVGTGIQNFTTTLQVSFPGGCTRTVSQVISSIGMPGAALVDPTDNFRNCGGSNFNMTVFDATSLSNQILYTIVWGDGAPNFISSTAPSGGVTHNYINSGVYELLYIVQATNGCIDTAVYQVSNITNPGIGAANPGGSTGCGPLTLCFPLNNYSLNHNTTQYIIDYGDDTPFDTIAHPPPNSVCHTYDTTSCGSPGNAFTFRIRAINSCDESEASISPIRIFIAPIPNFEVDTGCVNQPVTLTNNTITGFNSSCSSVALFEWDFGDGTTFTTTSPGSVTHTYTAAGRYIVKLAASNNCASDDEEQEVCIEDEPNPDFLPSLTQGCAPFTTTLTNTSTIGVSCRTNTRWTVAFNGSPCMPSTGLFQFVGGTDEFSLHPQIEFLEQGEYTVTLQMTNSCGLFENSQTFLAQSFPQTSLGTLVDICAGDSILPTSTNLDCLAPITDFLWTFNGGVPSSSTDLDPGYIVFPSGGNFSVQLTLENACGAATTTSSQRVNPTPGLLNPLVSSPLCENDTARFVCDTVIGAVYAWSGPNGFSSSTQNFDINLLNQTHEGWYTVFATLGVCDGPIDSVQLIVNAAPIVTASLSDSAICLGDTAVLSAIGANSYVWSPADSLSSNTGTNVFAFPSNTTNYVVFGSDGVCLGIDTVVLIINALPVISIGPDTTICNQAIPVQFNATPNGGFWSGPNISTSGSFTVNGPGQFTILYTVTDANSCIDSAMRIVEVIDVINAVAGPDTSACLNDPNLQFNGTPASGVWTGFGISSSGQFTPNMEGVFMLKYEVGSGNCYTADSLEITVKPLPDVQVANDTVLCVDEPSFQLIGNPVNGLWSGTGVITSGGQFDPGIAGAGNHFPTLRFTDAEGCTARDSLRVTINGLPVVNAGNDTTICNQPIPVSLRGLPSGGFWTGPNISSNGEFTPSGTGTFKLFYNFTSGANCFNLDSILITVNNPIPSDAGSDLEICLNEPPVQLSGSPTNGIWTGANVTPQGLFNPIASGLFPLSISNGTGNCLTSDTMLFTVHALPIVNAGLDQEFCLNDPDFIFSGSPVSGVWTGQGIINSNNGSYSPRLAGVGNHIIEYGYVDPITTCYNVDTLLAVVYALPLPDFQYNAIACAGVQESFSNTSTNAVSFDWNFGDGATSSAISPNHTYASVGFYSIRMIAFSNQGCIDTINHPIEVREPPIADFSLTPDSSCSVVEVAFTNFSAGIGLNFFWDFGNGNTSVLQNPANQFYSQGVRNDSLYFVNLRVSNSCGVRLDSATVRAMPMPVAVFAPESDVTCDQFPLAFVNNSYGLPDLYEWDFGNGYFSTQSDSVFTHAFDGSTTQDTTHVIRLIVTNECGKDTSYRSILISPSVVNAFFNSSILEGCSPLTVQFSNFSQGSNFSSWDFGDGNLAGSYNATHTFTAPGQYRVRLFANNNCDFDTAQTLITVHPDPLLNFSFAPDSVCTGEEFQFTNLSSNANSYRWNFGDGDTSILNSPRHSYDLPGDYLVTLRGYSTQYQCNSSVSRTVRVKQQPTAGFDVIPPFGCAPLSVQLENTSLNAQFIEWDFGNGNTGNSQVSNQLYSSVGSYIVRLIAIHSNFCRDTAYRSINVFESPNVDFSVSIENHCALPLQTQFNNLSTGAISYNWSFGDGQSSGSNNPAHSYQNIGPFSVTLLGENTQGCRDSMTQIVQGYNAAEGQFQVSHQELCTNNPVTFTAQTQFTDSVLWILSNGVTSSSNPFVHSFDEGGFYTVQLICYGQGGCNDTIAGSQQLILIYEPKADFTFADAPIDGVSNGTVAFQNLSEYADKYYWEFGNGETSTEVNPIVNYTSAASFDVRLIASNNEGCADTAVLQINVVPYFGLFIPNAINPQNVKEELRYFSPKGVGMAEYELWIYDDWGNQIWYTNALDPDGRPVESWDGRHKDEIVQQDAYVWKARAVFRSGATWEGQKDRNGRIKKAGTITVIH